jgi:thymidine kinase
MKNKTPEFVMFVGPMFSGKTTRLFSATERHLLRGSNVLFIKPKIDNRYNETKIVNHKNHSVSAISVSNGNEIMQLLNSNDFVIDESQKISVIAVDEAFMIDGISDTLIHLFKQGFGVYVSSIELSSGMAPFEEIQKMMPYATRIEKCTSICLSCGEDAHLTKRINDSLELIEVGGIESYQPVCWQCYRKEQVEI